MSKKVIFIVDDSKINNLLLKEILDPEYNVITFQKGHNLIQHLENHSADLIISDLMMPEISGIDILKKIKSQYQELPVIIISAYNEPDVVKKIYKLGADNFISKPINFPKLINNIKKFI